MPHITLIGERLAKKGVEFTYLGPLNNCKNCKLKNVCFNLKPGRNYEITNTRDKQHECDVHDGDIVVVEVKELPRFTAIDGGLSEGAETIIEKKDCRNIGCSWFDICTTTTLQKDKKYTIKKIYEKIECPKGYDLVKAEIVESS